MMDNEFIKAVQKLERATGMQWDDFAWLDGGHSAYAAYDYDEDESDGLMFGIAGNDTPDWAESLNGCNLNTVAIAAYENGAITSVELNDIVMGMFGEGGE